MKEIEEEILEYIWTMREQGKNAVEILRNKFSHARPDEVIGSMALNNLIEVKEGEVFFTHDGEQQARRVIRLHRLAETLFHEVLDVKGDSHEAHEAACHFEHLLNPYVEESICTLLGHPPICPHGKAIPSGSCCSRLLVNLNPLVGRLCDLNPGEKGKVSFITPRFKSRFDRLISLGLIPGCTVRLRQKNPTYVIDIDGTELAVDHEIAKEIFVRRV